MKTLIAILLLAILIQFSACKKEGAGLNIDPSLTGKWKVVGNFYSAGGPMSYYPLPANAPQNFLQFNASSTIGGDLFPEYVQYRVKDSVNIAFVKKDQTTIQYYYYHVRHDTLTMAPNGPSFCIEGCAVVLVKVQ